MPRARVGGHGGADRVPARARQLPARGEAAPERGRDRGGEDFKETGKNPYVGDEQAFAEGKKLYRVECQACHLPDGPGGSGRALSATPPNTLAARPMSACSRSFTAAPPAQCSLCPARHDAGPDAESDRLCAEPEEMTSATTETASPASPSRPPKRRPKSVALSLLRRHAHAADDRRDHRRRAAAPRRRRGRRRGSAPAP